MIYVESSVMVNWHIDEKPFDTLRHTHTHTKIFCIGHALSACEIFTVSRDIKL